MSYNLIIYKTIDNSYLEEALFKWSLNMATTIRTTLWLFLAGLLYGVMAAQKISRYGTFWNIWSSLAIATFFVAVIYLFDIINRRSKAIKTAKACIAKYSNSNEKMEYIFTDDFISARDMEAYTELKWSMFTSYQVHKNYLLLYSHRLPSSIIEISKETMESGTWEQLLQILSSKLPLKTK